MKLAKEDFIAMSKRETPPEFVAKCESWRKWQFKWNWMNGILGFAASALTALIAANTKGDFLPTAWAFGLASFSAGITFVMTTLRPGRNGASFQTASRILERAMAHYEHVEQDPGEQFLSDAEQKGIDVLDSAHG